MLLGSCLFLHSHPHSCCCLSWAFLSFSSGYIFLSMSVAFSVLQAHSHSQLLTFISSSLLLPWCKVVSMLSHLYLPKLFLLQESQIALHISFLWMPAFFASLSFVLSPSTSWLCFRTMPVSGGPWFPYSNIFENSFFLTYPVLMLYLRTTSATCFLSFVFRLSSVAWENYETKMIESNEIFGSITTVALLSFCAFPVVPNPMSILAVS